jgi:hypothetical protein
MTKYEQLKDKYSLWVDFLKESEPYKHYCQHEADPSELKKWPLRRIYWSGWNQLKNDTTLDARFQHRFFGVYLIFRDVHSPDYDFEKWWKDVMLKLITLFEKEPYIVLKMDGVLKWYAKELVLQLDEVLEAVFEGFAQNKILNKEYVMELCKIVMERTLKNHFQERKGFIPLLTFTQLPKEKLIKRFTETIVEHKRRYQITAAEEKEFMHSILPMPISKRLTSELETYLKVYRMRKVKVKWIDIVKQMSPAYIYVDKNSKEQIDENARRLFQLYREKAQNIIKNVENGKFPGEY